MHGIAEDAIDTPCRERRFRSLLQFSLWGNKMDLSLNPTLNSDLDAMEKMQSNSEAHLDELKSHILSDHSDALWAKVEALRTTQPPTARIDIVLDNAGYELFTDLCLAHWLINNGYAAQIIFHTKCIPWFVSDASVKDVQWVICQLQASPTEEIASLGRAFAKHLDAGAWKLVPHTFWTLPHEFHLLPDAAPSLFATLNASDLIILKGDLNYRKLLADRDWPWDTPYSVATAGFSTTSYGSLRTLKANLCCGLDAQRAQATAAADSDWLTAGQYGVIQAHIVDK
eukprot:m.1304367 g.1304367  ORF g.1304367 m.1304367 type:complete len:284 (-) comp24812_c0_seq2:2241-3092(-)